MHGGSVSSIMEEWLKVNNPKKYKSIESRVQGCVSIHFSQSILDFLLEISRIISTFSVLEYLIEPTEPP